MSTAKINEVIFRAFNHHTSAGGVPPSIATNHNGYYYGYFENEHREQFIFIYEYQTKKATLWAGDNGWEDAPVVEGKVPSLILSETEAAWVLVCWSAATTFQK